MRLSALLAAAALAVALCPDPARADGLLDGISENEEIFYSLLSTKTRDASGTTTKIDDTNYGARTTFRLNYNLLPKLNLNAGGTYEKNISDLSGGGATGETDITRFRPYVWLTLGDPLITAAAGYDLADDTVKSSGQPGVTLTRETYSANLNWRPPDLPFTQVRYTRTSTRDDPRASTDTEQNQVYLKSEYLYRGLNAYYAGTYLTTDDNIRDFQSSQITHEGKLAYATTLLDGGISLTTDNRVRFTELTTENAGQATGLETGGALPLPAVAGLSALDDTPLDEPLVPNPLLIDGDTTTGAGLNIGFPGLAGDFRRRNVGLDFGSAVAVNRLRVWVDGFGPGVLPADITGAFHWDIYTSTDNLTWSLRATVPVAVFGPFDRRFEMTFPAVTTRYIKAVTRPLSGGIIGSTNSSLFPTILITEMQAFIDRTAQGAGAKKTQRIAQTFRSHNVDVRVRLFRSPSLYYRFNGDYQEFDPDGQTRFAISNGLFYNQRLTPIFSTSANASLEVGSERDQERTAILYYAALVGTPLKTLTDSLVVSGNEQWIGQTTMSTSSVVLYNTAQLYRGLDTTLNLGAVFTSDDEGVGSRSRRRDLYVNLGAGVTPHPSLTMTAYYLGKLSHASGGTAGGTRDTTENRLDLALFFTPFRTLVLSASANVGSVTRQDTTVLQSYGMSWAPFPDGQLQFSLFYAENRLPENSNSRIIQPTVRWYLTSRRRSYLEASYQFNTTEASAARAESQQFSTRLNIYF